MVLLEVINSMMPLETLLIRIQNKKLIEGFCNSSDGIVQFILRDKTLEQIYGVIDYLESKYTDYQLYHDMVTEVNGNGTARRVVLFPKSLGITMPPDLSGKFPRGTLKFNEKGFIVDANTGKMLV